MQKGKRLLTDAQIHEAGKLWLGGMHLRGLAMRFGVSKYCLHRYMLRAGYRLSPEERRRRDVASRFVKTTVPLTDAEIAGLIERSTRFAIPPELRREWRSWPLVRRVWFVRALRAKLQRPGEMPTRPFSANVTPFDYGSELAHALVALANVGTDSRSARAKIDICSQGVIYRRRLYFWTPKAGYVSDGGWNAETGRPLLTHRIWADAHGGTMPEGCVIRMRDGNPNNLDSANLVFMTKNDVARENHARAIGRKSAEKMRAVLELARAGGLHAELLAKGGGL